MVNNSGITRDGIFFWMEDKDWDDVLETNVTGLYNVTRALVPAMIKKRGGAVVNVASVSGIAGNMGQTNYSASKGAVIAFTKALSLETARYNVRVNCVAPGLIVSEMTAELDEKSLKQAIPMRRFGTPEEVAEAIFFLAEKATYATGEVFNLSGGLVR